MDRLFSALVLGIYLASCAPALPPAGSAANERIDGRGAGRASSAGRSAGRSAAAKSVLPDLAREERLVTAWQSKTGTWHGALERALQEQIPEMRHLNDVLYGGTVGGLFPAQGFDPKNMWGNTVPHTYVYQVNRGSVIVPEGEHKGKSFYDVRQVGFLFSKVEERERTDTAYISKAELLAPYFALCFGEKAMQRQAGNLDLDYSLYPLVKKILDKGLNPADYTGSKAYHDLYMEEVKERLEEAKKIPGSKAYLLLLQYYGEQATVEHGEYLKQYDLYVADMNSPLEPGETQLHREFIAGQGIDFASPEFTARLNSFSVRKNAYENIGDVIDGYWETLAALADSGAFGRAFRRAVENLDAYLAARNVDTGVNLPTYFKIRRNIPVYRCYAPRLAVCGAAQALSLGWLQVPVVAVELNAGSSCWLDVPRITSADSNKLGIQYASFETGRGNGQRGFSGYDDGEPRDPRRHVLNGKPGEWRPDKFSMGAFSRRDEPNEHKGGFVYELKGFWSKPTGYPANRFAEAYLQCNYPYKMFSRAALKGMTQVEAARVLTKTCGDSIPEYWLNLFHGEKDDRVTTGTIIKAVIIILMVILTIVSIYNAYQMYQAYLLAEAMASSGLETSEELFLETLAETIDKAVAGVGGVPLGEGVLPPGMTLEPEVFVPGVIVHVADGPECYAAAQIHEGWTLIVQHGEAYFVPNWLLENGYTLEFPSQLISNHMYTGKVVVQALHSSLIFEIPVTMPYFGYAYASKIAATWVGEMLTPIIPFVFA